MDGAILALRGGAVDFVPKPFSADQMIERVTRSWTDTNRNYIPDCDLTNPLAQDFRSVGSDACGTISDLRFGQANYGTSGLDLAFRATESTAVVVNLRESYWISHQDDFVTYRGGVRYSKRPGNRITGFAQVLAGTAIGYKAQCDCSSNPSIDRGNGFSFSAGGGLDVGLKKWFGVRVIQAEYEMTRVKGHTSMEFGWVHHWCSNRQVAGS
jgi:hypothetical protein